MLAGESLGKDSIQLRQLPILAVGSTMKMMRGQTCKRLQPMLANAAPGLGNWHSRQAPSLADLVAEEVLSQSPVVTMESQGTRMRLENVNDVQNQRMQVREKFLANLGDSREPKSKILK